MQADEVTVFAPSLRSTTDLWSINIKSLKFQWKVGFSFADTGHLSLRTKGKILCMQS